ncbi:MAG TPA: MBL fold metallo-hydrolase [Perlabentimonas sp.]|nr:MBL fold metallo-hydrolase [Bacteroidales bacterium]MDD4673875.1 MBL fold metallo-hydrolase [Bacteroidales bacterium]MDY0348653.1 MBL fold metallo-hydrolase [Tenuifilaceae bacterium]HZJ73538.1 MBL fold metallo-hydrolase [Perlabentimonas sp.]
MSQGIPLIGCSCRVCTSPDSRDKRLRTSALVEHNGTTIAIDAGPDFRQQILRTSVKKLDAILLTHEHRDHIAGLDDVRAFNYLQSKPMDIWAESRVIEAVQNEFAYVFADDRYPGAPEMNLYPIDGSSIKIGGVEVLPIRLYHGKLPIYGFRFGNLTYITDANQIPETEWKKIADTEILVINALRMKNHPSHFSLPQAVEIIEKINPRQAYLTHISHRILHREAQDWLPSNVTMAYDGLEVEV